MPTLSNYKIAVEPHNVYFRCVEDCNDTVMISDNTGKIIYVNPSWQELYGYNKKEALGKTARLLHSGHHGNEFYQAMWKSITDPKRGYWRGEIANKSKTGTIIHILLTITPFRNPAGKILGYMGIGTDISAQKALEQKLKIQEHLEVVRHFSERLAHEIGTTLAVIRGRAEIILHKAHASANAKDSARIIVSHVDKISRLITYLFKFARNSEKEESVAISLSQKVEKAIRSFDERLKTNLIDLELRISKDITVHGNRQRLLDALTGLIENAIDAIEHSVKLGETRDRKIIMKGEELDGKIVLTIQDTGVGISSEKITKIFQPFFTTKGIGEGTGMGLTMASRFIEGMGGEISVDSTPNVGTVFKLTFPQDSCTRYEP